MSQQVKSPSAMQETQETWVQSLGWKDFLEEKMAAHSNILVWKISQTEELGELQSKGWQRIEQDWTTEHSQTHVYEVEG